MKKISLVLPIKLDTQTNFLGTADNRLNTISGLERTTHIQLPTFKKFLKLDEVEDFFIICLENELDTIKEKLTNEYPEFPFVFINEDELIKEVNDKPGQGLWRNIQIVNYGWVKQQLVKYAICDRVKTDFYVVLDTDVFLTKEFGYKECFFKEKLIYTPVLDFKRPTNLQWWLHSVNVLRDDVEEISFETNQESGLKNNVLNFNKLMGVTPQTYLVEEMQNMFKFIESKHNTSWLRLLLSRTTGHPETWEEQTLYWSWLTLNNKEDKLYTADGPGLYGNEIWRTADNETMKGMLSEYYKNFDLIFNTPRVFGSWTGRTQEDRDKLNMGYSTYTGQDDYFFSLCQSNIAQLDNNIIVEKLQHILEKK